MIFFSYFSKDFLSLLLKKQLVKKNTDTFHFFKDLLRSEHVYLIGDRSEYREYLKDIATDESYHFLNILLVQGKWINTQSPSHEYLKNVNVDYYFDVKKNISNSDGIINLLTIDKISDWKRDEIINNLYKRCDRSLELKIKANQNLALLQKTKQYIDFVNCFEKLASFSSSIIIYDKYISSQLIYVKNAGSYVDYNYSLGKAYNDTLKFFSDKILSKSLNKNLHCKIICIFDPRHNYIIDNKNRIENSKMYEDYSRKFFSNLGKYNGSMHIKDGNKAPDKEDMCENLFDLLHDRYFLFFDHDKNLLRMVNFKNGFDFIKEKPKKTKRYMFTPEKRASYEEVILPKIEILKDKEKDMFSFQNPS